MPPALLHMIDPAVRISFAARIEHSGTAFESTVSALKALPFTIVQVVSGSEPGVELTDVLNEALGLPGNGTKLSTARRDKYLMGETVRAGKVRVAKQAKVSHWTDVEAFVRDLNPSPFKVVIKPIKSAGSDHVYLCDSLSDLKDKFAQIVGIQNQLGQMNEAAVIQEYLMGTEYVVDTVSRAGVHKVVALWSYDKRSVNGFNFVYFGMRSIDGSSPLGQALATYQKQVLTALGIQHGAGHGEVILTPTGPCLVEVGARCHGCEGTFIPLADRCWGYNQVSAVVDASLPTAEAFDRLPDVCGKEKAVGFKVDLVSPVKGKLLRVDHLDKMRVLPSFMQFDALPNVGDQISVTIDCFTAVGSVTLANKSEEQLDADILVIRELEKSMFVVE